MQRAIIVRGRLIDGRTILLDEPVRGVDDEVDVVLRESLLPSAPEDSGESLVAVIHRDDVDRAIRGGLELEVLRGPPIAEDYTESPVVLARRASATIPAGPPIPEDTPTSNR